MSDSGSFVSRDAQALMAFESAKKSAGVAYLLWVFLAGVGGHRFYMGRTGSAVGMIALLVLGWATIIVWIGVVSLGALGVWALIDVFLIGGWGKHHNAQLMARLTSGSSPVGVMATA